MATLNEKDVSFGEAAHFALLRKQIKDEALDRESGDANLQDQINHKQSDLVAGDGIVIEDNVISATGASKIETFLDTSTKIINHTFKDSVDGTYSNSNVVSAALTIPGTVKQGFLSCITISSFDTGKVFNFTNNSTYPLKIVVNNIVVDSQVITSYSATHDGRKVVFCSCDGVIVEVSIIEEV